MEFTINNDLISKLKSDLNKKYLKSGGRISGDVSDNKVVLFLEDDHGKHSAFMSQYFYGKITGNKLTGKFRPSNYVIIILTILFLFAVESLIAAIILKGYNGVVLPSIIIAAEVLYFVYLNKISAKNNNLIKNYLSELL